MNHHLTAQGAFANAGPGDRHLVAAAAVIILHVRLRLVIWLGAFAFLGASHFAFAGSTLPILGSKYYAPNGIGWGTASPQTLYNGGERIFYIWKIRWTSWGAQVANGRAFKWIFRPTGGYYAKPVRIELRAHEIGRCAPGQPKAYLQLDVREPSRPGGPLGNWLPWGGAHLLCY